jgi:hypothetical protein
MLQKVVNVSRQKIRALYPCSGADITSILLATDAKELAFVDLTPVSFQEFQLGLSKNLSASMTRRFDSLFPSFDQYKAYRQRYLSASSNPEKLNNLADKLFFEIGQLVDLKKVRIIQDVSDDSVEISFPWAYRGQKEALRTIKYIQADITNTPNYPAALKNFLSKGLDFFYMKSAFHAPLSYEAFIPHLRQFMNKGSWFMTSSRAIDGNEYDTSSVLSLPKTPIPKIYKKILALCDTQIHPMATIPNLELPKSKRSTGMRLDYWHITNLVRLPQ